MATAVTHYVDPNAAAGGNGTTNALTGTNCAYTSLAAWEAAQQRDLVTADEVERVICSSDDAGSTHAADTTALTVSGWTTDATRYIQIEASPTSRASAVWSDNKYRLSVLDATALVSSMPNTKLIGLQIEVRDTTKHWIYGIFVNTVGSGHGGHVRGCYTRKNGGGNYIFAGIFVRYTNFDWQFINNITVSNSAYNHENNSGLLLSGGTVAGDVLVVNNTIIGFAYSIYQEVITPRLRCLNNISQGAVVQSYFITSTTKTCDYNISSNNYDTGGAHDKKNTTVTFETGSYKLDSTDTAAKDAGLDLSDSDNNPWFLFDDDIDGDTRTAPWDIGADEYVANGGLLTRYLAEVLAVNDARASKIGLRRILAGAVGVTDARGRAMATRRILADLTSLADVRRQGASFARVAADLLGLDDREAVFRILSLVVADVLGVTDYRDVTRAAPAILRTISDFLGVSDLVAASKLAVILRTVADQLGIYDHRRAARDVRRVLSEQLGLDDEIRSAKAFRRYVSEVLSLPDDMEKASAILRRLAEAVGIQDSDLEALATVIVRTITDQVGLSDASSRLAAVLVWLSVSLAMQEPAVSSQVADPAISLSVE